MKWFINELFVFQFKIALSDDGKCLKIISSSYKMIYHTISGSGKGAAMVACLAEGASCKKPVTHHEETVN